MKCKGVLTQNWIAILLFKYRLSNPNFNFWIILHFMYSN